MVTLVSFLLTIFTEFRQLTTNLQALCSLTARIKKGKTAIKKPQSKWQLRSPVGVYSGPPQSPEQKAQQVLQASCSPVVQDCRQQPWTGSTDSGDSLQPEWHSQPTWNHPSLSLLKLCIAQRRGVNLVSSGTRTITPLFLHRTGLCAVSATYPFQKTHCTQENGQGKIRNAERTNSHVVWSIVISM